ncbi:hypothetical protein [Arthrobacter sp. D5-1]|uniref:hypothetical protein n=1 Tax=Arthrobacter sp. D5-1 TaxID=1477518 RepID=UPI001A98EF75|nr:hypothetical protein [Arthrobacter sp. D5-1]QSZ48077.1 hypothetical protein AYX22_06425 [Arthrobacter sp. D5-1]
MTTARKLRILNIASTVLLMTVVILQSTQVISMFWGMALLVLIGVPTTVVWVILERRQGAEKMRGVARLLLPVSGVRILPAAPAQGAVAVVVNLR